MIRTAPPLLDPLKRHHAGDADAGGSAARLAAGPQPFAEDEEADEQVLSGAEGEHSGSEVSPVADTADAAASHTDVADVERPSSSHPSHQSPEPGDGLWL